MGYKEDYENYQTGDWYEIERQDYIDYFDDPDSEGYDPSDSGDILDMIRRGKYRQLFETAEDVLRSKPTILDYHYLYNKILDELTTDIVFDNLSIFMAGEEMSITYEDIVFAYEKEKRKLDSVFNKFVAFEREKRKYDYFAQESIEKLQDFFNSPQKKLITTKHWKTQAI